MKVVKRTADYTVYQKRSERYAVKNADKAWINGDEKTKILLDEGLIKVVMPAPAAEEKEPEPEAPAEDEAAADEAAADESEAPESE